MLFYLISTAGTLAKNLYASEEKKESWGRVIHMSSKLFKSPAKGLNELEDNNLIHYVQSGWFKSINKYLQKNPADIRALICSFEDGKSALQPLAYFAAKKYAQSKADSTEEDRYKNVLDLFLTDSWVKNQLIYSLKNATNSEIQSWGGEESVQKTLDHIEQLHIIP